VTFTPAELELIREAIRDSRWGERRGEFARLYQKVSEACEHPEPVADDHWENGYSGV
jgi:hypothetical protein